MLSSNLNFKSAYHWLMRLSDVIDWLMHHLVLWDMRHLSGVVLHPINRFHKHRFSTHRFLTNRTSACNDLLLSIFQVGVCKKLRPPDSGYFQQSAMVSDLLCSFKCTVLWFCMVCRQLCEWLMRLIDWLIDASVSDCVRWGLFQG